MKVMKIIWWWFSEMSAWEIIELFDMIEMEKSARDPNLGLSTSMCLDFPAWYESHLMSNKMRLKSHFKQSEADRNLT